tara:strand:- start:109020 stop:109469 length:450 start_codon:yes stop_codon:yes gene_type:complete
MNTKLIKSLLFMTSLSFFQGVAHAAPDLQHYCPSPYGLTFKSTKQDMGKVDGMGETAAKNVHFENPYMRSKQHDPAYVPAPTLDEHGYFEESKIDAGRTAYYNDGSLTCYYLYPIAADRSTMERLILISDHHAFQQCENGQVIVRTENC